MSSFEGDTSANERYWEEKYQILDVKYKKLKNQLAKSRLAHKNLQKTLDLLLDHTRQQEWVLPENILKRLPRYESLMLKAALQKVPYGRSPAEYAVNILFFLSLPKADQLRLGEKLFQLESVVRPENYARLQIVSRELSEFIYLMPDEDMKIEPEYPYLKRCIPKRSTNPRSKWMDVKNRATNFFPMYTRVTVSKESDNSRENGYWNDSASTLYLEAESSNRSIGSTIPQIYRIKAVYDGKTGRFHLEEDNLHSWEIANYGVCTYMADFKVSHLVMDNNPPYGEGMKGIVQMMWTGKLVYESMED